MPLRCTQSGPGPYTRVTLAPVCLSGPTYPVKERLCTFGKGLGPQDVQAREAYLLLSSSYSIPTPCTSHPSSPQQVNQIPDLLQELTPLAKGTGKKEKRGRGSDIFGLGEKSRGPAEGTDAKGHSVSCRPCTTARVRGARASQLPSSFLDRQPNTRTSPAVIFLVSSLLLGLRLHQGLHSLLQKVLAEGLVDLGDGVG